MKKHKKQHAVVMPNGREKKWLNDDLIVSKTCTKGNITYGNKLFVDMSGYGYSDLLQAPHNIIRHPLMPKAVFKLLWDTVAIGKEINAYVVNLAADGSHYWVFGNVTPSYDEHGKIIGYYSVRREPHQKAIDIMEGVYKKMTELERAGGVQASTSFLVKILEEQGTSYDKFILSI